MSATQKIIAAKVVYESQAEKLTATLSEEGSQGWRIQSCSTSVDKGQLAYEANCHFIVLKKSSKTCSYKCIILPSRSAYTIDLNTTLNEQSENGYQLVALLHTYSFAIGSDERGATTPQRHIVIFEKED